MAITGLGVLSPLGNSAAAAFDRAVAGHSAIRLLDTGWAADLHAPLAGCVDFQADRHFDPPRARMLDRVSQFALVAARQALADARLQLRDEDRVRAGIFMGSGMGGSTTTDEGYHLLYAEQAGRVKPFSVLMSMSNAPAAWIGIELAVSGPALTYCTACSSSAVALGEAWLRIRQGQLDLAIAGGAEAPLCFGVMKAWEALHALASVDPDDAARSCKPFARDRSGLVLAEGAAILILEEWSHAVARGAAIHGELLGYGLATDANHMTRPSVAGQAAAMRAALDAAGCEPSAIGAINAHGTGTAANDGVETAAIKQVFAQQAYRMPVSATKAIHGHLLGASPALELALALLALRRAILLPTMHLLEPDEACDLDYVPNRARQDASVTTVMSNSFAFGGTNAVLIARTAR
ncbi:MAG TPA: beta-ketoacyl-[acyl-carrier-protein] synthase family protein [Steroidobacteraceae bacterium]|nr:beta-ketoacyl-[acyl-carrier-protein] synthase family protein [Steroidobacteraceae bacterium]